MKRLAWALILASAVAFANEGKGGEGGGEADLVKMEPFVVNVGGGHVVQYVPLAKLADPHEKDYVTSFMPVIRFELIKAILGEDYAVVRSPTFMTTFAEKAAKVISTALGGDYVKEILFASWLTQ